MPAPRCMYKYFFYLPFFSLFRQQQLSANTRMCLCFKCGTQWAVRFVAWRQPSWRSSILVNYKCIKNILVHLGRQFFVLVLLLFFHIYFTLHFTLHLNQLHSVYAVPNTNPSRTVGEKLRCGLRFGCGVHLKTFK